MRGWAARGPSLSNTIYPLIEPADRAAPELRPFIDMVRAVVTKTGFALPSTREEIIAAFERHVAAVKAANRAGPAAGLRGQAGVRAPLPAYGLPRTNTTEDFWKSSQAG